MKFVQYFTVAKLGDILAIFAGALLTLAFAPYQLCLLAILSLSGLLALWLNTSPARAFFRGWLFGLGFFGTGVHWVFISIHTYGNTPAFIAGIITGLFIAILALFPAVCGYLLRLKKSNTFTIWVFPFAWVLFEWLRSWMFTGFPWLTVGYSQINFPLRGYAPIFSVLGVSFAALLSSALIVNIVINLIHKKIANKNNYASILLLGFIWVTGSILGTIPWTAPLGLPIKVSLVQGNIPQELKWSDERVQSIISTYLRLSENAWDSNIIIWPESAIPVPAQSADEVLRYLDEKAKQHKATIITGIPVKAPVADGYYNAVLAMGDQDSEYYKRRLVPFGEYLPFRNVLHGLIGFFNLPMSDFISATDEPAPLLAGNIKIATFICYEIAFPSLALLYDNHVNLLLTVSDDAWFGESIAQAQHLQIAQMRALELGRPVLFVSNNGITAIINSNGKIKSAAPPYAEYVLTDTVQPTQGETPWQRLGGYFE